MSNTTGLKQRICEAESAEEVVALMAEGAEYDHASEHTRHQWLRISKEKIKTFEQERIDAKKKGN
ncbi:hypothetical protein LCGC14_2363470 [marine sediment metagenome]|uniref:Uncharacterized protein n=1 Tax=marine sediment metagenome TaxID=412755 RepID=A0A0F9C5T4_9ZZZZ